MPRVAFVGLQKSPGEPTSLDSYWMPQATWVLQSRGQQISLVCFGNGLGLLGHRVARGGLSPHGVMGTW
ncbi:hypothetical protein VFPPC_17897 [Pochonia chlamydosporia 170]|uniref:Uncharacterized protein n=1 Tax=Pochonia chlamydosporia 170 TaxID=1380566 RepID=A0A219AQ35_METCM|nr:hypothetical protein VFPPC_17897 [Pochonia chlamydosporia 170]OWT42910.1 hypothetical protein VFPPC_17897 [Pochonia chlamydosporia 170]